VSRSVNDARPGSPASRRVSARAHAALAVAACALALASCSPAPDGAKAPAASSPPASSGTPAGSGPRVVLPSGKVIDVELARSDDERAQGLMYRASMAKDHGMVFLFEGLDVRPFWMKNCHFPLDMVYTLSDGTVVDVLRDVPPCAADPCPNFPPKAKADTVLELNAGVAPANGVAPGVRLRYVEVPGR
jgi:uncharacterized protein